MSIEVSWADNEESILMSRFVGDWTWQDYQAAVLQIVEMTFDLDYRIDQLVDLRDSGMIPSGSAITHIKQGRSVSRVRKRGITVFVGANALIHGLVAALEITVEDKITRLFADSIEDALEIIRKDRRAETS